MSAPNDAGTPALSERTAQVQGKAPRPRVAQWETGSVRGTTEGPGAARGANAGTGAALGAAGITGNGAGVPRKPVGKGQVMVAEPPGQSKTETPTRGQEKVWRRWSRENPTRQRRRVGRSERGER